MMMKEKAALYIRVSTTDQAMHGYSLDAQEALLREYASAHGMEVYDVYPDEGKSAAKALEKRKELLRLLDDAKRGRFSIVLFKDITRWSRSSASYFKVQEILDAAHVGWVAVEQPYLETLTPTGRWARPSSKQSRRASVSSSCRMRRSSGATSRSRHTVHQQATQRRSETTVIILS